MRKITRHPLYATADALKRAFAAQGFTLEDDGADPELQTADWAFNPFYKPGGLRHVPILLEDHGEYALRNELVNRQLGAWRGRIPLRTICVGRIYDAADAPLADHLVLAGAIIDEDVEKRHLERLWFGIAAHLYGLGARAALEPIERDTFRVAVQAASESFTLAHIGRASEIARALLGLDGPSLPAWIFEVDIDAVAMHDFEIPDRASLYSPLASFLSQFENDEPACGQSFESKAIDTLRSHGYLEFSGARLYEQDCYEKMNMIMESWDLNNRGFFLKDPLGGKVRVPTVRTPALEDALEGNYKAGAESARLFEIGQHFVSDAQGRNPVLKSSISVGAYGPGIDKASFRREVDSIMSDLGISNHFFIPIDMAIPYDPTDCWILMDEHMKYLGGNFGTINQIALDRHGLGVKAYMLQIEIEPLRKKAEEEFDFSPAELS